MNPHTILIICCLLHLLPTTTYGAPEEANEPVQVHDFRFTVYPVGTQASTRLFFQEKPGTFKALEFRAHNRSRNYSYQGEGPFTVFTRETGADGKIHYLPIADCAIPPSAKRLLFLISWSRPSARDDAPVPTLIACDDDPATSPPNSLSFINLTGMQLGGQFGSRRLDLPPGVSSPWSLADYPGVPVPVILTTNVHGREQRVLSNQWTFHRGNRILMLLLPPSSPGSHRIRAIQIVQHQDEWEPRPELPWGQSP